MQHATKYKDRIFRARRSFLPLFLLLLFVSAISNKVALAAGVITTNHAPIANGQTVITDENTAAQIVLTASDADNDPLTYTVVSGPAHGTLTGTGTNRNYTPGTNFNGFDSFTFKANDGKVDSNIATVSITVKPVNSKPKADNKTLTTPENTAVSVLLSGSDVETPASSLTYTVGVPQHGTLSRTAPNLTYTPNPDFTGSDSFTYTVTDTGKGTAPALTSEPAAVSITVTEVNYAPTATDDSKSTPEDTQLTFPASDLTTNDSPGPASESGQTLTVIGIGMASHGTVSLDGGTITYSPEADYNGEDSFTYTVQDNGTTAGVPDPKTAGTLVKITVTPVNDAPTADDKTLPDAHQGVARTVTLSGADIDSGRLSFSIVRPPAHGTLSDPGNIVNTPAAGGVTATAQVSYTTNPGSTVPDSFTYQVNDGNLDSNIATVNVGIVNNAPVAQGGSGSAAHRSSTAVDFPLSASDVDGDALTYYLTGTNGGASHGSVTITGNVAHYTPNVADDYVGSDSFAFQANDATDDSSPATIAVTLTNSAPTASVSLSPAGPKSAGITATAGRADADGDTVSLTYAWQRNGTMVEGQAVDLYTGPRTGGDIITVTVTPNDGHINGAPASASVTVLDTAPVASNTTATVPHRSSTAVDIPLSASDDDGDALVYRIAKAPAHGTVTISDNIAHYAPDLVSDYFGGDEFQFVANDSTADSNTAKVTVDLTNAAPSATVSLSPASPRYADPITASAVGFDDDRDTVTLTYVWQRNGSVVVGQTGTVYAGGQAKGDTISVLVTPKDGHVSGATATASVTIANTAPAAVSGTTAVPHHSSTAVAIPLSASDADGDALTYHLTGTNGGALHGTVSITGSVAYYTPNAAQDCVGADSFQYQANDGTDDSNFATIAVTLTNSAPAATVSLSPASPAKGDAIKADATGSDADSDAVTLSYVWKRNDTVVSGQTGANFTGDKVKADRITVEVTPNDGHVDGIITAASVTVVNSAPAASDQSVTLDQNTTKAITLTASDADQDSLTYTVVMAPAHGTLSGTAPNLIYTPNRNFSGSDSFTFKVNDGSADSNTATIHITVNHVNQPPTAENQYIANAHQGTAQLATLLGGDIDSPTLSFRILTPPAHGTISAITAQTGAPQGAGSLWTAKVYYTASAGSTAVDSFTYQVNDGSLDSNIATVNVGIVNNAPVAQDGSGTVAHGSRAGADVPLKATDADGDSLIYSIVKTLGGHGTVTVQGNIAHYVPSGDFVGNDTFQFKANDGTADSNTATVTMTVTNSAPTATVSLSPAAPKANEAITATATTADADGDAVKLTYVWKKGAAIVRTSGPTGSLTDTYSGLTAKGDVISVEVTPNDGYTDGAKQTASVTVANTPPSVSTNNSPVAVDEGQTASNAGTWADADKDAVTLSASVGAVVKNSNGTWYWSFATSDGPAESQTVTIMATDIDGASSTTTFALTVKNVAPTPTITGTAAAYLEGTAIRLGQTVTDPSPVDTNHGFDYAWSVTKNGIPYGAGTAASSFTFTPNDNGTYVVTFSATDKDGAKSTTTKTITVTNVAPAPVITSPVSGYLTPVNTSVAFTGTFTDPGVLDTHSARWNFTSADTTIGPVPGVVTETGGNGSVKTNNAFTVPGIYEILLTVQDKDGGSGSTNQVLSANGPQPAYVVVYDGKGGGFVTGGGYVDSPAGAMPSSPSAVGKAHCGFVVKYLPNSPVPQGNTEFQFQNGNVNFHCTSFDWLVVNGARAQASGSGTINGYGNYGFILTVIDGKLAGDGLDRSRMRIWDKTTGSIIYDNQMGTTVNAPLGDGTILSQGSVVIHK